MRYQDILIPRKKVLVCVHNSRCSVSGYSGSSVLVHEEGSESQWKHMVMADIPFLHVNHVQIGIRTDQAPTVSLKELPLVILGFSTKLHLLEGLPSLIGAILGTKLSFHEILGCIYLKYST